MNPNAANEYLKAKVLTATPEQLQLMLYDGAIRFAEKGRAALEAKQFDVSYSNIGRAEKILMELQCGLKPQLAPELCKNLAGLYMFCYRKLVDANMKRDTAALDEALHILRYQRETWVLLMQKLSQSKAGAAAAKLTMPAPDSRMEQSIRLSA
jgi:flagellar secretion chaperone FliS